jgi:hypothetical protein
VNATKESIMEDEILFEQRKPSTRYEREDKAMTVSLVTGFVATIAAAFCIGEYAGIVYIPVWVTAMFATEWIAE